MTSETNVAGFGGPAFGWVVTVRLGLVADGLAIDMRIRIVPLDGLADVQLGCLVERFG